MLTSPRRPSRTMRDLLFNRMMPPDGSPDIPDRLLRAVRHALARLSHRRSPMGYDEPEIPPVCSWREERDGPVGLTEYFCVEIGLADCLSEGQH